MPRENDKEVMGEVIVPEENDVEAGQKDAPRKQMSRVASFHEITDPASLIASIKNIFVGVPGPCWQKVFYFILQACAIGSFIASSVTIIRAAAEESITAVEVKLADIVPMPGMFVCTPAYPGTPYFEPFSTSLSSDTSCPPDAPGTILRNTWGAGLSQDCFRLAMAHSDSSGAIHLEPGATAKEEEFLGYLIRHFQKTAKSAEWGCFIGNADGNLMNDRKSPTTVEIAFLAHIIPNETHPVLFSQGFLGLFDASLTGDLNDVFQSNAQMYGANIINGINTLKFTYDKMIDYRDGYLGVLSNGKSTEEKGKVTNVFAGSLSSTPAYFYKEMSHVTSPMVWFSFEVSSFVSREITIRNKYLSEMWTEIGGAWASALLITTFFFVDKVGGMKGKYHMFRFNTSEAKKAMMDKAAKEFGGMFGQQVGEDLNRLQQQGGEVLHGTVGEANMETAMTTATRAQNANTVVSAIRSGNEADAEEDTPEANDEENEANGATDETTALDDQIMKKLDEFWAVEKQKMFTRMKAQLELGQVDTGPPLPGQTSLSSGSP